MSGAAIHRMGMSSMLAPSVWKMRLTFAFCSAKPNCRPRNPRHMFQICQNDSSGFARPRAGHWRQRTRWMRRGLQQRRGMPLFLIDYNSEH